MVDVLTVSIRSNKDTVYVDEPVTVYYDALLDSIVSPRDVDMYRAKIVVYVDGVPVKSFLQELYEGYDRVQGSVILSFSTPGDHTVSVDISIVPVSKKTTLPIKTIGYT